MIKRPIFLYILSHTAYFVFSLLTSKPWQNNPSCLYAVLTAVLTSGLERRYHFKLAKFIQDEKLNLSNSNFI